MMGKVRSGPGTGEAKSMHTIPLTHAKAHMVQQSLPAWPISTSKSSSLIISPLHPHPHRHPEPCITRSLTNTLSL